MSDGVVLRWSERGQEIIRARQLNRVRRLVRIHANTLRRIVERIESAATTGELIDLTAEMVVLTTQLRELEARLRKEEEKK